MLFDLYQLQGREADFESIAIDYASHFETSPPTYTERLPRAASGTKTAQRSGAAAAPGVSQVARFSGLLDAGASVRLQALPAAAGAPVRLDFGAVTGADAAGCAALLATLQSLRAAKREVVLAGADTLLAVLRPMLAIGERSTGEAPWLLLLELLLLLGREKDFEETAMDYCVTFEVSPPSFEASAAHTTSVVPTAAGDGAAAAAAGSPAGASTLAAPTAEQRFVLPVDIDGDIAPLLAALEAHAATDPSQPLVLDCGRVARIGFGAAGSLHAGLRRLAVDDRRIELRELNHLVAALLRLLNYNDCARLYAHKY
ncbi:STAS domain-containing protein [Massilia sp. Dwa41.01b]|uniref:STAS domain-containing protein n=2 Tax=unclassified Massilia TaxID=2609279 RepID=UPI001E524A2F|nr:STAS domain-containing protein [Massilia sp. Dwa41.01b]